MDNPGYNIPACIKHKAVYSSMQQQIEGFRLDQSSVQLCKSMTHNDLESIFNELFMPKVHLVRLSLDQLAKLATKIRPASQSAWSTRVSPVLTQQQGDISKASTVDSQTQMLTSSADKCYGRRVDFVKTSFGRRLHKRRCRSSWATGNSSSVSSHLASSEDSSSSSSGSDCEPPSQTDLYGKVQVQEPCVKTKKCIRNNNRARLHSKHLPPSLRQCSSSEDDMDSSNDQQDYLYVHQKTSKKSLHSILVQTATDSKSISSSKNVRCISSESNKTCYSDSESVECVETALVSSSGKQKRVTPSIRPHLAEIQQGALEEIMLLEDCPIQYFYPFRANSSVSSCKDTSESVFGEMLSNKLFQARQKHDVLSDRVHKRTDGNMQQKQCQKKDEMHKEKKLKKRFELEKKIRMTASDSSNCDSEYSSRSDSGSLISEYAKKTKHKSKNRSKSSNDTRADASLTTSGDSLSHRQRQCNYEQRGSSRCQQQQQDKDQRYSSSSKDKNIFGIFNIPPTSSVAAAVGDASVLVNDNHLTSPSHSNSPLAARNATSQPSCSTVAHSTGDCRLLENSHMMQHNQSVTSSVLNNTTSSICQPAMPSSGKSRSARVATTTVPSLHQQQQQSGNVNLEAYHTPLSPPYSRQTSKNPAKLIDRRKRKRASRTKTLQCQSDIPVLPLDDKQGEEGHVTEVGSTGPLETGIGRMFSILELKYGQLGLPPLIPLSGRVTSSPLPSPSSPLDLQLAASSLSRCNGSESCSVCTEHTMVDGAAANLPHPNQSHQQQQQVSLVQCISPALATDGGRTSPACPTGGSRSELVIACDSDSLTVTSLPAVAIVQPWQPDTTEISFESEIETKSDTELQPMIKSTDNANCEEEKKSNHCSDEQHMKTFLGRCGTIFNFKQKATPVGPVSISSQISQQSEIQTKSMTDIAMTESRSPAVVQDTSVCTKPTTVSSSDSSISCATSISVSSIVSREDNDEADDDGGQGEKDVEKVLTHRGKSSKLLTITNDNKRKIRINMEVTWETTESVLRTTRSLNARNFARARDKTSCSKFALKECMIGALVKREGPPFVLRKKARKFFVKLETMRAVAVSFLSSKVLSKFNASLSFGHQLTLNRIAQKLFASGSLQKLWRSAACDRMSLPHCATDDKLLTSKAADELFQDVVTKYVQFRNDSIGSDSDVIVSDGFSDVILPSLSPDQSMDRMVTSGTEPDGDTSPVEHDNLSNVLDYEPVLRDSIIGHCQSSADCNLTNCDGDKLREASAGDKCDAEVCQLDNDSENSVSGTVEIYDYSISEPNRIAVAGQSGSDTLDSASLNGTHAMEASSNRVQSMLATHNIHNRDSDVSEVNVCFNNYSKSAAFPTEIQESVESDVSVSAACATVEMPVEELTLTHHYSVEKNQTCENCESSVEQNCGQDFVTTTPCSRAANAQSDCSRQTLQQANNSCSSSNVEDCVSFERQPGASERSEGTCDSVDQLSCSQTDNETDGQKKVVVTTFNRQQERRATSTPDDAILETATIQLHALIECSPQSVQDDADEIATLQPSTDGIAKRSLSSPAAVGVSHDILSTTNVAQHNVTVSDVTARRRASYAMSTCSKSWLCEDDVSSVHTSADTVTIQQTVACHVSSVGSTSGGGPGQLHWKKKFMLATVSAGTPAMGSSDNPHQRKQQEPHQQQTADRAAMAGGRGGGGFEGSRDLSHQSSCARVASWLSVSDVGGALSPTDTVPSINMAGVSLTDYKLCKPFTVQLNDCCKYDPATLASSASAALTSKTTAQSLTSSYATSGTASRCTAKRTVSNCKGSQLKKVKKGGRQEEWKEFDVSDVSDDQDDDNEDDDDESFSEGDREGEMSDRRKGDGTAQVLWQKRGGKGRSAGGGRGRSGTGRGRKKRRTNGWSRPKHGGSVAMVTTNGDSDENTCVMCLRTYRRNEEWIKCNACARWMHRHCGGVTNVDWCHYVADGRRPFTCPRCYDNTHASGGGGGGGVLLSLVAVTAETC